MHSRIVKLEKDLSIPYSRIDEKKFEENGFLDFGCHDYVKDDGEKSDLSNYQWIFVGSPLGKAFSNFHFNEEDKHYYVTLKKENLKQYLRDKIDIAMKLMEDPIDNMRWFDLKCIFGGDDGGFYFYMEDEYQNDMDFLTYIYKIYMVVYKVDEVTFRLEGTLDYHF